MLKSATHRTPLHDACIGGHVDCVALLLDVMENVELSDKNGQTAAHLAAFNGEAGALKLLLEHGESEVLDVQAFQNAKLHRESKCQATETLSKN